MIGSGMTTQGDRNGGPRRGRLVSNAQIWTGSPMSLVGNGDVSILADFVVAGDYYPFMSPRQRAMPRRAQPQSSVGGAQDG